MGGNSTHAHDWENSTKLGVPLHLPFVHRVVRVEEESIGLWKRGNGGANSNKESVDIGDENDGTLIGKGILSLLQAIRNGGESSPLLKVKGCVGVGDEAVSLSVGTGAHDDPAEHGVAAIPDFSLDGWTPTPFGELWVFYFPVFYRIIEDRASNAGGACPETVGQEKVSALLRLHHTQWIDLSSQLTNLETFDTAEVDGANAEAEPAARKRAAKVRRGAMVEDD